MSQNEYTASLGSLTVGELYRALDARIPAALSCSWDNDGLSCCPDPTARVTGILVALDATEDAVDLAEATGCNVILTHHPLLFKGLKAVAGVDVGSRRVIRLIRAGISTMAFHTRLDALEGGVNDVLAARLGLTHLVPFDASPTHAPIGRIGELSESMTVEAFAAAVKDALSVPATLGGVYREHMEPIAPTVTYVGCGRPVRRVAVLGGSGQDELDAAVAAGADTYVTGELRYHQLCDAPAGEINLICAGHYFTEFPICVTLADMAAAACPGVPVHILGGTRARSL